MIGGMKPLQITANDRKKVNIYRRGFELYKVTTPKRIQQYVAVKGDKSIFGSIHKIHRELYGY